MPGTLSGEGSGHFWVNLSIVPNLVPLREIGAPGGTTVAADSVEVAEWYEPSDAVRKVSGLPGTRE